MKVEILKAGHCSNIGRLVWGDGKWKKVYFPALCMLLEHPTKGYMLIDTGYSSHFKKETKRFPFSVYAKVTPVSLEKNESLKHQLRQRGIRPNEIKYILLTHFHGDHVSGLKDFPNATIICSRKDYEYMKSLQGVSAVRNGFVPSLLPNDVEERMEYVEDKKSVSFESYPLFEEVFDIFGDGYIQSVSLPGHTIGQIGYFVNGDVPYFHVADSCWTRREYEDVILPSRLARGIIHDMNDYKNTLEKVHQYAKENTEGRWLIPSHCMETFEEWKKKVGNRIEMVR